MKASEAISKADKLHKRIDALLEPFNKQLRDILGDKYCASPSIFYQTDGWCILFGDEQDDSKNALICFDIDALLKMNKMDALKVLQEHSI